MLPEPDKASSPELEGILDLFSKYQRRLYLYILSMLPSPANAEEVLQETNIVVWRKFDQFEPGTDFRAWVFRICLFEVRKFHARQRQQGLSFSDELLDELASQYDTREDQLETRQQRLAGCIEKLRPADRELVGHVYGQGIEVGQLAVQTGREKTSIYRSLRRIRQMLLDCVQGLAASEATA